ncbi:hypothetical protein H4R35_000634 [Dimargaris xerosporica]|nr:hypothetical protein H4R35_000634 [Dimargaris xerosporica]
MTSVGFPSFGRRSALWARFLIQGRPATAALTPLQRRYVTAATNEPGPPSQRLEPTSDALNPVQQSPQHTEVKELTPLQLTERLLELTPDLSRYGSRQPYRHASPLSRTSLQPNQFTMSELLAAGLHLGHAKSLWHPHMLPFIFGQRAGIHIINLEHTVAYLRRALDLTREVARQGGIILFVATRDAMVFPVAEAATECGQYHINGRWRPGTLTNSEVVLSRCSDEVVPNDDALFAQSNLSMEQPSDTIQTEANVTRYTDQASLVQDKQRIFKPDLMVFFNLLENKAALAEAKIANIPTIGIVDTDCDPYAVTYPVPANDDSVNGIKLLAALFSKAAEEGRQARQHQWDIHRKATASQHIKHDL